MVCTQETRWSVPAKNTELEARKPSSELQGARPLREYDNIVAWLDLRRPPR